jgi:hypothetical protein
LHAQGNIDGVWVIGIAGSIRPPVMANEDEILNH